MSYFTSDFIAFFKELSGHNNKEWFDQNRKRYQKQVKEPFEEFVDELIARVREDDPSVDITPKDAILRINRDIRFAKDKTPYNTYVAAIISPGGKKDKSIPGNYIRLSANEIRIYGGAHFLDTKQLFKVRKAITENMETFSKIIQAPDFRKTFGEVHGERHKRVPPEFRSFVEEQPLIANKQFYYYAILDAKHIQHDDLPDTFMAHYHAGKPLNQFLRNAMAS